MNFDRKDLLLLDQNSYDYKPETVNRPPPTMRREDEHQGSDSQWLQKEKKNAGPTMSEISKKLPQRPHL